MRNEKDETALLLAVGRGYAKSVQALINADANVDIINKNGNTALILAVVLKHLEIVQKLLDAGAKLDLQNLQERSTALMIAANRGLIDIIQQIINAGKASGVNLLEITDNNGETALMYAIRNRQPEAVKLLLDHGANACYQNSEANKKNTPLIVAVEQGSKEIVEILIDRNSDCINAVNSNNDTALMFAAILGHLEIVQKLLDAGADPNCKNLQECTALEAVKVKRRNLKKGKEQNKYNEIIKLFTLQDT